MSEKNIKSRVVGSLIWVFFERMSTQLISMIVSIVLARILAPEHYGTISIVAVFIAFLNVFITSGFGVALVQKKDADEVDFDTAFLLSLGLSVILYAVMFAIAPAIAAFFETSELCEILRVMGVQIPLAAVNNIQRSYLQRNMKFKRFFWVTLGGTVASGVAGIIMAICGMGVWALVVQYISNTVFSTVILFIVCPWHPHFRFSLEKAKEICSFGWRVLATQLVSTIESDIRSLIIGKKFGTASLAYYDHGKRYPSLLVTNISSSIDSVMLPAYSKEQDNRQRVLAMLRRSIQIGLYVLAPVLIGFAAVSDSFIELVLTEKWMDAAPYLRIFCIVYLTRPIESSCKQALLSIGKSGRVLVLTIIINVIALLGTVIAVFALQSVLAVAFVSLVCTLVSLTGYILFSRVQFQYKFKMQIQDAFSPIAIGVVMYVAASLVGLLPIHTLPVLLLQILTGVIVYVGLSALFRVKSFVYILEMLKIKRKRQQ